MNGLDRDDVIRMAREAGYQEDMFGFGIWDSQEFNDFADLVAAAEREACALAVEQAGIEGYGTLAPAAIIRTRGNYAP
jgi:hypothetical protein